MAEVRVSPLRFHLLGLRFGFGLWAFTQGRVQPYNFTKRDIRSDVALETICVNQIMMYIEA
jgi:hypothetical protein